MALEQMKEDNQEPLQLAIKRFGIDPIKDIKSLTVYGFKVGENDGVAVFVTSAAVDGVGPKLEEAKFEDFESSVKDGVTRYSWKMDGQAWHVGVRSGSTPDKRIVLVAPSRATLECGLGVVTGARPNIKALDKSEVNSALLA